MTEEKTLEEFLHDLLEKEKERHEQLLKEHEELIRMTKQLYTAKEVAELCGISESSAYKIIARLNKELKDKGYLTFSGKVSRAYFSERMYGGVAGDKAE